MLGETSRRGPGRPALDATAVEEFRGNLCDVALRLFSESGYQAVTLRSIARELGCSHTLAYRYFPTKQAIFDAVRQRGLRRFAEYHEAREDDAAPPRETLVRMAAAYIDFAIDNPHEFRVMFDAAPPDVDPSACEPADQAGRSEGLVELQRRSFRILKRAVVRAIASGVLGGNALELAHLLWASVHGVASLHVSGSLAAQPGPRRLAELVAESVIRAHPPSEEAG